MKNSDSYELDLEATHRLYSTMWQQKMVLDLEKYTAEIEEMKKEYERKFNLFRQLINDKVSFKAIFAFLCIAAALITGSIAMALRAEQRLSEMVKASHKESIVLSKKIDRLYEISISNKTKLENMKK